MKSYNQALKILKKSHLKISSEVVKSVDSINRICSSNIYSKNNHPSENNSALDGFAINSKSTKGVSYKNIKKFKIVGSVSAGSKPYRKILKKNEVIEIMTGGIMPKGCNSIIPIEECTFKKKILGGDRTHNLLLRRQSPYPLGHEDIFFVIRQINPLVKPT